MVFLILAAFYERWRLSLAVLTVVPLAIGGALLAVWLRGMTNDIYLRVGVITLIGLAAKNAVLIVDCAARRQREGLGAAEAALAALRLRFRPVVMTSLAFILGCLPLVVSTGAGAGARRSISTGVTGGMLAATVLALVLVPAVFRIVACGRERGGCGVVGGAGQNSTLPGCSLGDGLQDGVRKEGFETGFPSIRRLPLSLVQTRTFEKDPDSARLLP
jgi:multidrug efflux pump